MKREKLLAHLGEHMRSLYDTGNYYVSVPPVPDKNFEEGYWHTVVDPDGRKRDRLAEKNQCLVDIDYVFEYLKTVKHGSVLDVGCGLGWFLSALPKGWKKYGLEVSKVAADYAAKFGDIFHGTLLTSRYKGNMFDVIFMHHVIEHLAKPEEDFKIIKRILKPGGLLILGTPDFDSGCARLFGKNYRLLHDGTHVSLFSNDSLHRFLRDTGFAIQRVEYPFWETRFFTKENLMRLFDTSLMSPPFYGNFMTFFCTNEK